MRYLIRISVFITIIFTLASCQSKSVVVAKKPLYDTGTWALWNAVPGDVVVYHYYQRIVDQIGREHLPDNFGGAFEEMSHRGPSKYMAFVLVTANKTSTFWAKDAAIIMTYRAGGKTYEVKSKDFFVIKKCDLQALRPTSFLMIPSPALDIFETPNKWPVIFAEFDFPATPDTILYCKVVNVQSR